MLLEVILKSRACEPHFISKVPQDQFDIRLELIVLEVDVLLIKKEVNFEVVNISPFWRVTVDHVLDQVEEAFAVPLTNSFFDGNSDRRIEGIRFPENC